MTMKFSDWLRNELEIRQWKQADLARRSNLDTAVISNLINERRGPGEDTCSAIAHALGLPPETVFRAAGLLPAITPDEEEWELWKHELRKLDPEERARFHRGLVAEVKYKEELRAKADLAKRKKTGPLPHLP
jgi:transcriptional regulator with XRE-family HTH domain